MIRKNCYFCGKKNVTCEIYDNKFAKSLNCMGTAICPTCFKHYASNDLDYLIEQRKKSEYPNQHTKEVQK